MTLNALLDEVRFASGDTCICVEDDVISLDSGCCDLVQALIHNERQVGVELTCLLKPKRIISLPHILNLPIIRIEILIKGGLII